MESEKIKRLLAELDGLVPKDGAAVLLKQYGGGPDESQIVANEQGYLRFGIEIAKLAFEEKGKGGCTPDFVFLETGYLMLPSSTVNFDWCERRDIVQDETYVGRWYEKFVPFGCLIVALVIFGLAGHGLFSIVGRLLE